jgi:aspartyl-tRNA(Asn)/glutamyl-tRNA(Gln) amidotransferase subunit C
MPLERADVEHIAALARIGLSEDEVITFQEQLSNILDQFELLRQLDTSAVEPTGHAVELNSVMREDEPEESLSPEDTLLNAPRREGDLFRVKAVLEE